MDYFHSSQYKSDIEDLETRRIIILACESVCYNDRNKLFVRKNLYDSSTDRKVGQSLNSLLLSAEHLRYLFDRCMFSNFAAVDWDFYGIREFLLFDTPRNNGREFTLSNLGNLYNEYKEAQKENEKAVKRAKSALVTRALNGYQMPIIRHIEVYEKAVDSIQKSKVTGTKLNNLLIVAGTTKPEYLGSLFKD